MSESNKKWTVLRDALESEFVDEKVTWCFLGEEYCVQMSRSCSYTRYRSEYFSSEVEAWGLIQPFPGNQGTTRIGKEIPCVVLVGQNQCALLIEEPPTRWELNADGKVNPYQPFFRFEYADLCVSQTFLTMARAIRRSGVATECVICSKSKARPAQLPFTDWSTEADKRWPPHLDLTWAMEFVKEINVHIQCSVDS